MTLKTGGKATEKLALITGLKVWVALLPHSKMVPGLSPD